MKLALLTMRLAEVPMSGGELCTARLVRMLAAAGHEVVRIGLGPPVAGAVSLGPATLPFDELPPWRRVATLAAAYAAGQASTVRRLGPPGPALRALGELGVDAIVVDHLQPWAWIAGHEDALPPAMLVMHNLESALYAELARHAGGARRRVFLRESRLLAALERRALARAAVLAALSDPDRHALLHQGARSAVVLPGYALDRRPVLQPRPPDGTHRIGLIGHWGWRPNRLALAWMLAEVQPRLPPHARLVLAGAGLPPPRTLPAGVLALGRVADAAAFYAAVDAVALPAIAGSGVQEKAIDAIASALPVAATPHALRGLLPVPAHVRVAGDAAAFAAACMAPPQGAAAERAAAAAAWSSAQRRRYAQALSDALVRLVQ